MSVSASAQRRPGGAQTHRHSEVHDVRDVDHVLIPSHVPEQVVKHVGSLVPDEPVVLLLHVHHRIRYASALQRGKGEGAHGAALFRLWIHTSEKAGAAILRWRFHSSPSVTRMFVPNVARRLYDDVGFGKRARAPMISCSRGRIARSVPWSPAFLAINSLSRPHVHMVIGGRERRTLMTAGSAT